MMMSYRANRTHTRHRPRHNQQLNHVRHEKKKNKGEDKDSVAAYQNDLLRQQRTSKRPRSMNILLVGHVDTCWLHISSHHILFDTSYHTPFQPPFNPTLNPPSILLSTPPSTPPQLPLIIYIRWVTLTSACTYCASAHRKPCRMGSPTKSRKSCIQVSHARQHARSIHTHN